MFQFDVHSFEIDLLYLFWKVCPAVRWDVWFHVSIFKLIEAKRYKIPVWSIPGVTCAATVGHLIRNTHKCPIPPLRNECNHIAVRTVSTKPLLSRHMSNNAGYAECSLTDFLSTMLLSNQNWKYWSIPVSTISAGARSLRWHKNKSRQSRKTLQLGLPSTKILTLTSMPIKSTKCRGKLAPS